MKTLLLNEIGERCLNTLLGIIIIISYFQWECLYRRVYYKYNLLKYNYFYFLNQQNLESAGLKTEILKKLWPNGVKNKQSSQNLFIYVEGTRVIFTLGRRN